MYEYGLHVTKGALIANEYYLLVKPKVTAHDIDSASAARLPSWPLRPESRTQAEASNARAWPGVIQELCATSPRFCFVGATRSIPAASGVHTFSRSASDATAWTESYPSGICHFHAVRRGVVDGNYGTLLLGNEIRVTGPDV